MIRGLCAALVVCLALGAPAIAQTETEEAPRAETGGAQTLEDILRRQRGEDVDLEFRRNATGNPDSSPSATSALGTRGFASDPDLWRSLRFGDADITSQVRSPGATLLVQDDGMNWLEFRDGPLSKYGRDFLIVVLILLAVFYLVRDRIKIDAGRSGQKIRRFSALERFAHWLLAGSFIVLGISGMITLFGRNGLIPLIGHDAYASLALANKWVHNNVAWAFIIALVLVFLLWVIHNIPHKTDLNWLAKGGGIFSKGHPPAKKFNAGQKLIFWSVIVLGTSIAMTGVSLLFPFELHLFAPTFAKLNSLGVPGWIGMDPLPEQLTPHAEMQLSQLWHAIVSFVLMGIVIAHIYIGSLGMEGAYDAMGTGDVDLNWAKEHHSLWVEEVQNKAGTASKAASPAE